jgi:tetratricopeptide (TPR) repeat protein
MKRAAMGLALALGLCGLARADIVTVRDPGGNKYGKDIVGDIKNESPGGITIKEKGTDKTVSPLDVQAVVYTLDKVEKAAFNVPEQKEVNALLEKDPRQRQKLLDEALKGFKELQGRVGDHEKAKRYVDYRVARCQAYIAKDDPSQRAAAVKALDEFRNNRTNKDGWEILPVLRLLAQMQEEDGKLDDAAATLEQVVNLPGVPADVKQTSTVLVAEMFIRARNYPKAEEKLDAALNKVAADDPQRPRLETYLVKAQLAQEKAGTAEARLRGVLQATQDDELRAMAYNLLGDYYRLKKQDEEAYWCYMRVHVLFNGNAEEQAKALYHLWKLYPTPAGKSDPVAARQCYDKLMDQKYAGTEFQALAAKEPKPGN